MQDEQIIWKGKQWQVSEAGRIEAWPATCWGYSIDPSELACGFDERRFTEDCWLIHLANTTWADLRDFIDAFLIACTVTGTRIALIGPAVKVACEARRLNGVDMSGDDGTSRT
ncbi:MAG: hypothetical protein KF735_06785 [Chelatococcus sp.]|uniref:hypothetical protein n=1 Tax=Chelatococcus sp. TaxID=1953771 RepID=UPI0025B84D4E|nr:hypothetical protein [Chelatococcus sp.]MBX3537321.1 hypothetical protein [Chelatococcus sp.]